MQHPASESQGDSLSSVRESNPDETGRRKVHDLWAVLPVLSNDHIWSNVNLLEIYVYFNEKHIYFQYSLALQIRFISPWAHDITGQYSNCAISSQESIVSLACRSAQVALHQQGWQDGTLASTLSHPGSNPEPAINCHLIVSQAWWFINGRAVPWMDVKWESYPLALVGGR